MRNPFTNGRRRRRAALAIGGAAALTMALLQMPASALPTGVFELEGNALDNPAADTGDDWETLFDGGGSSVAFTGIDPDPAGQTIFTTGGSKDFADIPAWRHTGGSVPDKDEITNAYAAAYLVDDTGGLPDGDADTLDDLIVYFGADRYAQNGSANIGFWFLEDQVGPVTGGTFSGVHKDGDTFVLSEFTNGGAVSTIQVWEWRPAATGPTCPSNVSVSSVGCKDNAGTLILRFFGSAPDCDSASQTAKACANVNSAATTVPWTYDAKGGGIQNGVMPAGGFFEGGVNLSAIRGGGQPCISTFIAETRSSPAIDAVLKDFVGGEFPLCSATMEIEGDAVNEVGEEHTFTVTVSQVFAGVETGISGVFPDVTLTDGNGDPVTPTTNDADNDCVDDGTNSDGECIVTFNSNDATVITGTATATVTVQGQTFELDTADSADNPDATKIYVDGDVEISPSATNGIGESHTFTVSATQTIGDGDEEAATDGHAVVTLADDDAVNEIDDAGTTCAIAGDGSDPTENNLDSNGECTVAFTSDVAGTVTGSVTVDIFITTDEGDITITRSTGTTAETGAAVKTFVDGTITWLKHDEDGNLLPGATFEVCQTHSWNSDTQAFVDITDDCFPVEDDVDVDDPDATEPDADDVGGQFKLEHLTLGKYTIEETVAPEGYALDDEIAEVSLDTSDLDGDSNIGDGGIFVDLALYQVIIFTCNTSTDELVVSSVTDGTDTKDTLAPGSLTAEEQAELCALAANFDNVGKGDHGYTVTIPKP
jgi:hypothetical protein